MSNEALTPNILIVEGLFYQELAAELRQGAIEAIERAQATHDVVSVPGAFEIPAAIRIGVEASRSGQSSRVIHGFVALGCVIRGETTHYDYVCQQSAAGLMKLALEHNLALGYGILTVENQEQAWARARVGDGNKGGAAAEACLAMIALKGRLGLLP